MQVRLAGIKQESVTDGVGLRSVVYLQGCPHNCPGCHNPESHDLAAGYLAEIDEIVELLCSNPLIDGITLSGGEPLLQPEAACALAEAAKRRGKTVWLYSGFTLAEILSDPNKRAVLMHTDVLIDGPFVLAERDLNLLFRGSRNQRLLTPNAWQ